jgi:type I restriction-modification system DNA methylase subunit
LKENEEYRYYNAILRNIFFHCLNVPQKDRKEYEYRKLFKNIGIVKEQFQKIPFLNGGLFNEQSGDDFPLNNEHFFSELTTRHILELGGDYQVEGIIRILSQYQYKLSIDDLLDKEYTQTVDPEFIGKVFESLLSCIDTDNKETRRKVTGSYYTPREIVDYMVSESLDDYLLYNKDLLQCKILDPACGSGAFTCGVVNEIMRRVDPDKQLSQKERYRRKLSIIQNVIYGIDIQPIAVQISILRLFLSLIQEIVPDKKKENYGIQPLPNLETKFICADTLLGLQKKKQGKSRLMFGVDNFDIVIGNPPYIEAKKLKRIAPILKNSFDVYSGTADLSIYFIEQGLKLCKNDGLLMLITTNKFFNAGYGKPVRRFLLQNQIHSIIDFEQVKVFDDVLVSSVILGVHKNVPNKNTFVYQRFYKLNVDEFKARFAVEDKRQFGTYRQILLNENEWSFSDIAQLDLKAKIENAGQKLSSIDGVAIYRGVTTGYNPAFIIDKNKRKELLAADNNIQTIIKPLLQGRNIRKWIYNKSDYYLLQTGFDLDVRKKYPFVFAHLNSYQKELKRRDDQGKNWWNLRACKYYFEFEQAEKIIWGLTADKWAYAYDDKKHYLPSNGYILTSTDVPIKYLLGLLNSNLLKYYFGFIGVITAGGAFTLKYKTVSQFPIVIADNMKPIIMLVDKILDAKQLNSGIDISALEKQIDILVYKLYCITPKEQSIINETIKHIS